MDFKEEQKINSAIISISIGLGVLIVIGSIFYTMNGDRSGEFTDTSAFVFSGIFMAFAAAIYFFITSMKLTTSIDQEGFHYQYSYFIRSPRVLSFKEMISWQLKTKKNIFEGPQSGYKKSLFSKQTSFMMAGKTYLEIRMKSGQVFLFSTQESYSLTQAIKKYAGEKEIHA